MDNLSFIELTERAYRYIRQFTIKNASDALIELITNCNDAYNIAEQTSVINTRLFEIEYHAPDVLLMRDQALGLSADDLQKCFLQIGNFTSDNNSRGFFSRGAKDISAIGDITFSTVYNNKFSQCYLNTDAYGNILISDVDATEEIRSKYKIAGNGLEVKINLLPNQQGINIQTLYSSICKLAVLRDIVSNDKNVIMLRQYDNTNSLTFEQRITYTKPSGIVLLDVTYEVKDYDGALARLVIYKADNMIQQPRIDSEMEFGFLIKDCTSIYEISTFDKRFRWDPYMPYLYGFLYCDKIHELLIDYDKNGVSPMNPFPIVDPSRLTGLNEAHPFIINLFSIPLVRLDNILRELNKSISEKSITMTEIDDILDELAKFGLDIIDNEQINIAYVDDYDAKLATEIASAREQYIRSEYNYLLSSNVSSGTRDVDRDIYDQIKVIEESLSNSRSSLAS